MNILQFTLFAEIFLSTVLCQSYEDQRCLCMCPATLNATKDSNKRLFISDMPPNQCNCIDGVLPHLDDESKSRPAEICARCECKYQIRNTTTIKIVVIIVLFCISLLLIYMVFLLCLDQLLHRRKSRYHREEPSDQMRNLLHWQEDEE